MNILNVRVNNGKRESKDDKQCEQCIKVDGTINYNPNSGNSRCVLVCVYTIYIIMFIYPDQNQTMPAELLYRLTKYGHQLYLALTLADII